MEWRCWPLWIVHGDCVENDDGTLLGLSDALRADLAAWSDDYDRGYDAQDPASSTVSDEVVARGWRLAHRVKGELGPSIRVMSRDPSTAEKTEVAWSSRGVSGERHVVRSGPTRESEESVRMVDDEFSRAVIAYTGFDTGTLPGHHPDRVEDPEVLARVRAIVAEADAVPFSEEELPVWAERVRTTMQERYPELTPEALVALRALVSYEWR